MCLTSTTACSSECAFALTGTLNTTSLLQAQDKRAHDPIRHQPYCEPTGQDPAMTEFLRSLAGYRQQAFLEKLREEQS